MKGFTLYELMLALFITTLVTVTGFKAYSLYRGSHLKLKQTTSHIMEVTLLKQTLTRYLQAAWRAPSPSLQPTLELTNNQAGLLLAGLGPEIAKVQSTNNLQQLVLSRLEPRFKSDDRLILIEGRSSTSYKVLTSRIAYRNKTQTVSLSHALVSKPAVNTMVSRWQIESFQLDKRTNTLYEKLGQGRRYPLLTGVKQLFFSLIERPSGLLVALRFNAGNLFKFFIPLEAQWHA